MNYLPKLFSFKQFRNSPIKLSMNFLVKNEADIIEDNIRFHATQGVDCFVVMDNGSTDGTSEIVDKLSNEFEIVKIDRPVQDYQQSNWKTEMAITSREQLGADWSIANDADEFWVSDSENLKEEISSWGSVLECPRINMIPNSSFFDESFHYLDSPFAVNRPIMNRGADLINDDNISIMLGNIHGKVMVNNYGLVRVKGGNHRAWHIFSPINKRKSTSVRVYHYPIRNKDGFVANIENRAKLLKSGVTKMGDHYRRWVRLYESGKIDEELNRLILSKDDARVLKKFGVVKSDSEIGLYIRNAIENSI